MDRDTVRIIILVIGALVIAGIYVWGRYKQKLLDMVERSSQFDVSEFESEDDAESPWQATERPPEATDEFHQADELQIHAKASEPMDETLAEAAAQTRDEGGKTAGALGAPFLIQLRVVKGGGARFPGERLRDALIDLDLVYGEMGIFHRYDSAYREPLFSVASLVEPGTFPVNDMENFRPPGVVFFFQPARVSDPLEVFDDLVETCRALAMALDGTVLDENRALLTDARVDEMREILAEACEQP